MFDFDGLIVDTEWPEYQSIAEVFARHGAAYPPQRWLHVIGTSWDVDWLAELEADLGEPVDREALTAERIAAKRALRAGMRPLPGVEALIAEANAAGVPLAVASSSSRRWVEGQLDALGLLDRFVLTRCLDDVTHAKPAPELYLAACAGLGVARLGPSPSRTRPTAPPQPRPPGWPASPCPTGSPACLDLSHADARRRRAGRGRPRRPARPRGRRPAPVAGRRRTVARRRPARSPSPRPVEQARVQPSR